MKGVKKIVFYDSLVTKWGVDTKRKVMRKVYSCCFCRASRAGRRKLVRKKKAIPQFKRDTTGQGTRGV